MNENYEVMENEVIEAAEENYEVEGTECESGKGLGLAALIVGGLVAGGAAVAVAIKKHKQKNADKPKKPKMKWVRVPVEDECFEGEENYEEAVVEE